MIFFITFNRFVKFYKKINNRYEWNASDCYNYFNYVKPWNITRLERIVFKALWRARLKFITQKTFPWLTGESGKPLRCDFYLPDKELVIECHGEQHFKPSSFKIGPAEQLSADENKRSLCEDFHGIKVIYFTEYAFKTHLDNDDKTNVFRNVEVLMDYILRLP